MPPSIVSPQDRTVGMPGTKASSASSSGTGFRCGAQQPPANAPASTISAGSNTLGKITEVRHAWIRCW